MNDTITAQDALFTSNNLWMMLCTALVFIMHLGFATLESGLSRAKNATNILFKNTIIPAMGLLTFCMWGFNLMYPGAAYAGGFFGFSGFGLDNPGGNAGLIAYNNGNFTYWTHFLFQAMFAATAATIVSGAVAERIKLKSFMVFSFFLVGLIYPVVGMWKWGGGWLDKLDTPFYDFAGSSMVHSVGGWAALAGVIMLGPRLGKYINKRIIPIPGHSMPLTTIGVFMLWLGWFGFNGGSVFPLDPGTISLVLVNTSLSAAAGAFGAMIACYIVIKVPDHTMMLNGLLGGLVGITAGADQMNPTESIVIGAICGALVVASILTFDRIKIDDPVGATSVHLVCGVFGTLAVGMFGNKAGWKQLLAQLTGVGTIAVFVFFTSLLVYFIIGRTMGLRVPPGEEEEGLDLGEHGMKAYNMNSETRYY
jgi:ammonium transporter, Amt family